jgi:uncharacterized protein
MVSTYAKPLPAVDDETTRPYWEGARQGQLVIQRCAKCGTFRWYPRPTCHACWSLDAEWASVSGRGTVYSYVVIHHAFSPAFRDDLPYIVVIVQLPEGVRVPATLKECAPEDVRIDQPVEVRFERVTDEVTLPYFVPSNQAVSREPA